jgi:hypothetical protein
MHMPTGDGWGLQPTAAGFTLLQGGAPLRTPLGSPVATRHRALGRRLLDSVREATGSATAFLLTPYALQVLYLDYARALPPSRLAAMARASLEKGGKAVPDVLGRLAARSLLAVIACDASFERHGMGLDVVTGKADLDRLCSDLCAFVAERRAGGGLGGDPRYYAPVQERNVHFCNEHCLPSIGVVAAEDGDCPPRTPSRCGTRRMLEDVRFFASFPEE